MGRYPLVSILMLVIVVLLATACSSEPSVRVRSDFYQVNIERALEYLKSPYNDNLSLIPEAQGPGGWELPSPDGGNTEFWTMDKVYWLGDNLLAAMALKPYDPEMSDVIARKVAGYGLYAQDDKSDLLAGEQISATPWIKDRVTLEQGENYIIVGAENSEGILVPWDAYADIVLMYSIMAWRSGDEKYARQLVYKVIEMWDGTGIWDGPAKYHEDAAVYKLALLLVALRVIGEPFEDFSKIERTIWQNQNATGGVVTGIGKDGYPIGGPNIETTALVLLIYDDDRIAMLRKRF